MIILYDRGILLVRIEVKEKGFYVWNGSVNQR